MLNRRNFCSTALLGTSSLLLANDFIEIPNFDKVHLQYVPIDPSESNKSKLPVPKGHRTAFNYTYFSLDASPDGLHLNCNNLPSNYKGDIYLRLQVAIDTRMEDEVEVYLGRSNKKIGHLSIWYPTGLQVFQTLLDCDPTLLKAEGLRLKQYHGKNTMYFYSTMDDNGSHLLLAEQTQKTDDSNWMQMLCSDRSLQPFGWTEGCTLDGLQELYLRQNNKQALQAIQSHLDKYLIDEKQLVYSDLFARPKDNTFTNLEAGLPFATIAQHRPQHPSINLFVDYCKNNFDAEGNYIPDGLSTEGCYTLAYPLVQLGKILNKPELFELAIIELEKRINYLADETGVYNIGSITKGKTIERRNWGRGYAWFLLGIVKSAEILQSQSLFKNHSKVNKMKETFRHYSELALSFQRPDYSWGAYLDQPSTGFESTATAGIAAAFANGNRIGWLPEFSKSDLNHVYMRLLNSTTPDGFLKNVTQHNAGDINLLQRGSYRVIAQYALGFMGQIKAHL
ncbi:glycoside hydrolase family 88 protein [Arenibacter algicola]|uniref:glycoside hydrolase family 88 protein n=1 Tax=Arenibacter algicola TaxID=616991 RepID=UPI001C065937|nr:glycoside hydrolase family 88 protein [Arenibacter algicola]MBU2904094.1 glycoside hydrolase family 88 protein [Arenibacter algicola]